MPPLTRVLFLPGWESDEVVPVFLLSATMLLCGPVISSNVLLFEPEVCIQVYSDACGIFVCVCVCVLCSCLTVHTPAVQCIQDGVCKL